MSYTAYLNSIKNELQRTGKAKKSLRVKTIMEQFCYQRRSQAFIDEFNTTLDKLGLCAYPVFSVYISVDTKIAISIKEENIKQTTEPETVKDFTDIIPVHHDFFYYLFDFGNEQEYERFQACLDSNQPIAIFLIPHTNDFSRNLLSRY